MTWFCDVQEGACIFLLLFFGLVEENVLTMSFRWQLALSFWIGHNSIFSWKHLGWAGELQWQYCMEVRVSLMEVISRYLLPHLSRYQKPHPPYFTLSVQSLISWKQPLWLGSSLGVIIWSVCGMLFSSSITWLFHSFPSHSRDNPALSSWQWNKPMQWQQGLWEYSWALIEGRKGGSKGSHLGFHWPFPPACACGRC